MAGGSRKTGKMKQEGGQSDSGGDVKFSKSQQFLKMNTVKEEKTSSILGQRSRTLLNPFEKQYPPLKLETSLQRSKNRNTRPLNAHLPTQLLFARSKRLPKMNLPRVNQGLAGSSSIRTGLLYSQKARERNDANYAEILANLDQSNKILADLNQMNQEMNKTLSRSRISDTSSQLEWPAPLRLPKLPTYLTPRSSLVAAEQSRNVPAIASFIPTATSVLEAEDDRQEDVHINLKVLDPDKSAIQFKIKRRAPMKKLINTYCQRKGLEIGNVRFLTPDGDRIHAEHTAAQLGLEDGDIIETVSPQSGGEVFMI